MINWWNLPAIEEERGREYKEDRLTQEREREGQKEGEESDKSDTRVKQAEYKKSKSIKQTEASRNTRLWFIIIDVRFSIRIN